MHDLLLVEEDQTHPAPTLTLMPAQPLVLPLHHSHGFCGVLADQSTLTHLSSRNPQVQKITRAQVESQKHQGNPRI